MLAPISIGRIKIATPVLLAPMAGITDVPYRQVVSSFGANLTYSEMISSNAMVRGSDKSSKMVNILNDGNAVAIQLAGSDVGILTEAAKISEDRGAAVIDLNMGCPVKKVVKGIAGSALMKEEALVARIFEALVKAVKVPVTVKMRLGWDCDNLNASKLAKIAQESGVSLVTVHGRTRQQMFNGKANWQAIGKIKESISIPVIVNGDIKDISDAKEALEKSGADGVMIGRGTYGKPWVINQITQYFATSEIIPEPSCDEKIKTALWHYNLLLDYYGEKIGLTMSRKHLIWYTKGLRNSTHLRAKINTSTNIQEVKDLVFQCFREDKQEE